MSALKVLIADDEPLAADRLVALLDPIEDLERVGIAEDGDEAVALAQAHKPDLVLLDISMPGQDGIEVARTLAASEPRPVVIFVTAYDRFAVAAFEVAAVDYLVKPVERARLHEAIERARIVLANRQPAAAREDEGARWLTEFWASDLSGLVRIAAADIDRVSAERDYMRLHVGERSWLIHHSMTALEKGLDPSLFVRLHRSAIVRRDFVTGFSRNASGRWVAQLADGREQPVGRLYADRVREMTGR
ncbi:LytR/AlgR family response regulator transcription factor [Sphingomicrobium astaxanthinifaciens]|uniref:LytR/AlgR family response regulator transcription factor n=1 Tax=Sphingomicrobium astaxanthinifaciens TaxID=1227949 RepID=UPI001FCC4748|nr:LytTR family DNA-binding domain-containing protein [Sphingomicrobium astaxanthinifaciens]MCJ7421875.1 LytTR family DNA-binding domain-containing protein [Sphingomicrobium astaxanthinifaciens]